MSNCCDPGLLRYFRARGGLRRGEFLAGLGTALAAAGCSSSLPALHPAPPTTSEPLILFNGTVLTLADGQSGTTAVAVSGGKVLATAASGTVLQQRYPHAPTYDLQGAVLAPGFVEAHAHISQVLLSLIAHDIAHVTTLEEFFDTLSDLAKATPRGEWLYAQGVDTSLLAPDYRPPTLAELDKVVPKHPLFVEDSTGHLYYINSAAVKAAGVSFGQTFPGGGLIGGNGNGLEGIVYEFAIAPFLKFARDPSPAELAAAMTALLFVAQRNGVTTWHDPAAGLFTGNIQDDLNDFYAPVAANPNAPLRLMCSMVITDVTQDRSLLQRSRPTPGDGIFYDAAQTLWLPSLKLWTDGTPQGETASMTQPYISQPPTTGFTQGRLDWSTSDLHTLLTIAKENGWSMLMHTNGDNAIDQALDAVQAVFGSRLTEGYRVRFEHCTVSRSDQFDRMKAIGVTPTFLNSHTYIWGDAFQERIIGPTRAARLDAAGDCVRRGLEFSFHCDYGVSLPQPLRYMQTAVTRRTKQGTVIGPDQAISPLEALKGCTIYPARQLGFDQRIGTIEPGKDADFVELAANPLTVAHEAIAGIPVKATWRAGVRLQTL